MFCIRHITTYVEPGKRTCARCVKYMAAYHKKNMDRAKAIRKANRKSEREHRSSCDFCGFWDAENRTAKLNGEVQLFKACALCWPRGTSGPLRNEK